MAIIAGDSIQRDAGDGGGLGKGEGQFDVGDAPRSDEVERAVYRFKVEPFAGVIGPAIRPLKVLPGRNLS